MRVSSLSSSNASLAGIQDQQSNIARLSQQIATTQKYLATKDAPIETSQALALAEQIAVRKQYQSNQVNADLSIKEENTVLSELDKAISTARGIAMGANASQDQAARAQLATQLSNLYDHIKGLANSQDTSGNYLFAGYQTSTTPYAHSSVYSGATAPQTTTYSGDAGIRQVEIDTGRFIQTNDNLDTVMQSGTAGDLLKTIDDMAVGLRDGTATQASLNNAYAMLNSASDKLHVMQSSLAGRSLELSDTKASTQSLLQTGQDALGQVRNLDTAAAIVELQQRQVALSAAENAFSLTAKQSLFNYL